MLLTPLEIDEQELTEGLPERKKMKTSLSLTEIFPLLFLSRN